jgi:hypothetical protein
MANDKTAATDTAYTWEEANEKGFFGEVTVKPVQRGTDQDAVINRTGDAIKPTGGVTGPGAKTDVSQDDKKR